MADNQNISNLKKDPQEWKTGDERATDAQKSYLQTMADEAGEDIDTENLSKAQAAEEIERLQQKTNREHSLEE